MEAFTDGVIAVIITIMVLQLALPRAATWRALAADLPVFLSYVLSFAYVGIYWNNHHHLLHATERVNGAALWANLHLLFWLSLIPFTTAWIGENHLASWPVAVYGIVLLLAGFAYYILAKTLMAVRGQSPALAQSLGGDMKTRASLAIYAASIALAFVEPWISCAGYVIVAVMWLVPDRRIERVLAE